MGNIKIIKGVFDTKMELKLPIFSRIWEIISNFVPVFNKMEPTRTSIFQRPMWVTVFALTAAIAWGWAFPLIKIGFSAFGITTDMTGSKMLFAGIRFAAAGLIVLAVARGTNRSFSTGISHEGLLAGGTGAACQLIINPLTPSDTPVQTSIAPSDRGARTCQN